MPRADGTLPPGTPGPATGCTGLSKMGATVLVLAMQATTASGRQVPGAVPLGVAWQP